MTMDRIHLIPAYGRKYATAAEVRADWELGLNFEVLSAGDTPLGRFVTMADTSKIFNTGIANHILFYGSRNEFPKAIWGIIKPPTQWELNKTADDRRGNE